MLSKLSECAMMEMFSIVCSEFGEGGYVEILSDGVEDCFLFGGPGCGFADNVHEMDVVDTEGWECPGLVKTKLAID